MKLPADNRIQLALFTSVALLRAKAITAVAPKSALGNFREVRVHAAEKKWDQDQAMLVQALGLESNQQEIYCLLGR